MGARIIASWMVAAVLTMPPGFGADSFAWGSAAGGVRLGIAFDGAGADKELRLLLRNTGSVALDVLIGYQTGKGTAVNFKFTATAPDGKEREGFEINSFTPIGGLVLPAIVRLDPAVTYELRFPLKKIICIEKPGDITFETLVERRYSVHVSLEIDEKGARWAGLSHPWMGKVTSGILTDARQE